LSHSNKDFCPSWPLEISKKKFYSAPRPPISVELQAVNPELKDQPPGSPEREQPPGSPAEQTPLELIKPNPGVEKLIFQIDHGTYDPDIHLQKSYEILRNGL